MARQSREAALSQAKAAKQKKLLFVLVPVFLGLAVWQGPKTLKAFTGGNAAPPPPAATLPAATTPSVTTAVTPPPSSVSGLNETDPVIDALEGQLISFSSFESKDPFAGLPEAATEPTPDSGGSANEGGLPISDTVIDDLANARRVAFFAVNGTTEAVSQTKTFPKSEPVFRLVAVESQAVRIGLVSGTFSTGEDTIEMEVGDSFVFVSETDAARYELTLLRVRISGE
jgi:hypothetical protein